MMLARSRVRQSYFESQADYIFIPKAKNPTEYELLTETYESKEIEKKSLL